MTATLASVPTAFTPADLDYVALAPVLIVFGAAVLGVVAEAFVPRTYRYAVQVGLTVAALIAALLALVFGAVHHQVRSAGLPLPDGTVGVGAVVIDGPTLFIQGAVLVFSLLAALSLAERLGGTGADAFTPMARARPGAGSRRSGSGSRACASGWPASPPAQTARPVGSGSRPTR